MSSHEKKFEGFDKWEVECWARSLQDAAEVMADEKKFKAAKKMLKKKKEEFKSIDELIAFRNQKYGGKS